MGYRGGGNCTAGYNDSSRSIMISFIIKKLKILLEICIVYMIVNR